PHAPRRTSTSPRLGASTLISSTWTGLLCSRQRTALALRDIASKYSRIKYLPCLENPMLSKDKLFIGGQWIAATGREMIDVHNAGNGEVMGRIPAGGEKDVDAAVRAARAAFETWAGTAAAARAEFLQKISDGLKARADELAKTIAQEVGMPLKLAGRIQAGLPIANFANYARLVREFQWEQKVGNS